MKNKLFILLSILFSILGFSNASALKHEYQTIPLMNPTYYWNSSSPKKMDNNVFSMSWDSSSGETVPAPTLQYNWQSTYDSSLQKCVYNRIYGYTVPWKDSSSLKWTWSTEYIGANFSSSPLSSFSSTCKTRYSFGSSLPSDLFPNLAFMPAFSAESIDNTSTSYLPAPVKPKLIEQLPWSYTYDHLTVGRYLSFSELWRDNNEDSSSYTPNKLASLTIPFDAWKEDVGGALTEGRELEFTGSFSFPGLAYGQLQFAPHFQTSGSLKLYWRYLASTSSAEASGTVDCTFIYSGIGSPEIPGSSFSQIDYSCPLTIPKDLTGGFFHHYIEFKKAPDDSYMWDSGSSDWYWNGFYTITDGDDTPGNPMSDDCVGNTCDSDPGVRPEPTPGDDDWFNRLTNLFNFNLFNPFAPLFSMFTHSDSCKHVPIIAGMLGASNDEYCPWFPSSVRNVLTPVFSISSMMLLFGFFVRWLGSDDGEGMIDNEGRKIKVKGGKK